MQATLLSNKKYIKIYYNMIQLNNRKLLTKNWKEISTQMLYPQSYIPNCWIWLKNIEVFSMSNWRKPKSGQHVIHLSVERKQPHIHKVQRNVKI